jgi:GTP-binding protein Era
MTGERPRKPRHKRTEAGAARTPGKVHRHKAVAAAAAADDVYRAGFACFVGRPNAGKSTLTNAIIGQKIAITSSKPQTTRHIIRGILHRENAQLVLVDTPGLHRPRTLLGERLNDLVRETWSEVDVIGVCFPADEPVGRGDRFISAEIGQLKATVVAVVTKVDLVDPATLAARLLAVGELYDFADIVPVSAVSGHQVDTLVDVLVRHLPESPQLYPDDMLTDEPEQVLIAELIREAALEGVRDELPHSIAAMVEEMQVEGNLTRIFADLYVERDSQKSIVIGTRGARLRDVGTRARAEIEALIGTRVYLDLHVRVAKEWQRDPRQLRKLGF